MKKWLHAHKSENGQSLVETALFLPILLLLLVGVVEVGNLMITQNRVTTSAQTGAAYGANHYVHEDWAGTVNAMTVASSNSITEMLDLDPAHWDMWSFHAKVNDAGDGFDFFEFSHGHGNQTVGGDVDWTEVQSDTLAQLNANNASAANLEIVGQLNFHEVDTVLGFDFWQWAGFQTLQGLTIMRVDTPDAFESETCNVLPIAMYFENFSLYPEDYNENLGAAHYPGIDPIIEFRGANLNYPNPPPVYTSSNNSQFPYNSPGWHLSWDAQEGYLYRLRNGEGSGGFGWLAWDDQYANANKIKEALTPGPPGNMTSIPAEADAPPDYPQLYTNQADASDHVISVNDWVQVNTGNIAAAGTIMEQYYIDTEQPGVVIIYQETRAGGGNNREYRILNFALVRFYGHKLSGNDPSMEIEFLRWTTPNCQ
ncbi:MAG TPA: TadE/TadG family type IV pilus assembly protein [Anaerolineae bacterium]|nr:TadE/TadG family type IV pilus assembly protein [Anaerolineae bacterium]